ncbi:hypothetical protein DFH07DRAFT_894312 [Mycena maculata]|uniref:Fork-head domain-containing protein n=1 Tax=Mycena maculata TaxID=230809 RepID=A0AAD7MUI8_9AGAR|nr:hypothetical protein DFH07DRAFT_894312 [Mycena maculata]
MAHPETTSPITQLLNSLGITREDLNKRSDQMRQFLTAENATASRVPSSQLSSSASESRPLSRASSSAAHFTRQLPRASSISTRDTSPPPAAIPVKSEPAEEALPPRQFDNMEMVLERQRLNRKHKRSKKRGHDQREQDLPTLPHIGSPTPRDALSGGPSQLPVTHTRDDSRQVGLPSRSTTMEPPPVTPMRSKYYREHTSYMAVEPPVIKAESPSPAAVSSHPPTYTYPYYYYSAHTAQRQFLSLPFRSAQASSSTKTPVKATSRSQHDEHSPLPPSSPPDASSPVSSPAHRLVNIVSSPGPELEDEDKSPAYTLPPGPYSDQRPLYSYAALIGQAILSSRDHRLTLQEIYEWIVTVYPHYKRGERTWMNSIRHVLSTTVHFRKVSRERAVGRSHWAIFDEDLECFVDGGYRKPGSLPKRGTGAARPRQKKRPAEDVEEEDASPSALAKKAAKRSKKVATPTLSTAPLPIILPPISSEQTPFLLPALVHPQGKPKNTRPAAHHQTYYESCMPAPPAFVPSEIIFPPLPNTSYRLISENVSSPSPSDYNVESEREMDDVGPSFPVATSFPKIASRSTRPSSPSSPSVPDLTPNNSSSSPIPTSEMDTQSDQQVSGNVEKGKMREDLTRSNASVTIIGVDEPDPAAGLNGEERVFGGSLRPVQFWESSTSAGDGEGLQPGIELQKYATQDESDDDEDVPLMLLCQADKLERQRDAAVKLKARPLVKMPTSPALHRRKTAAAARTGSKSGKRKKGKAAKAPPATGPSTPPRNNTRRKVQLSPMHAPLSHKGLHTSPSASLAHYKSHLDPPPTLVYKRRLQEEDDFADDEPSQPMQTPRKRNVASSSAHPMTPKRLLFSTDAGSSPFRTPGGGTLSASPFRTPLGGRGGIFDPHDPSTLLDEELSSLGAAGRDSPAGLYGKGALYASPNPLDGSPGKWARWW